MYDARKFKQLVHYVCSRRSDNPSSLGAVKLNKTLWLSDLASFYTLGHPITGARYVKRQFGPVPTPILPTLRELESEGVLTITEADHYGKRKTEYVVNLPATDEFLSPEERGIVERMIRFVCEEHTAASISEASHDHIWKAAEDGEEIPLFTVFAQPGKITEEEREWARMTLEAEGL
ncbi:MAG TPA: Panacea domain-containing protein [Terriglobia bacterium]|nr:Panacea domain-containing protein [Terriglobia bacterium]